jgi:hypothetical protein
MHRERRAATAADRPATAGDRTATTGDRSGSDAGTTGGASVRLATGPAPESRRANLSLWLGLAGFVLGFLLLFAILTPATIIAAVGGLREIRLRPSLRGRWKAWTGIGLAIAAPVLWVSAFLAFAENGTFGLF